MPAGQDDGQEKTLEPTPKKIEEAKERGEFPRSKEVTTVFGFLTILILFYLTQGLLLQGMNRMSMTFFRFDELFEAFRPADVGNIGMIALSQMLVVLLPVFVVVFVAAFAAEVGQIGFRAKKEPFEVKWNRIDPIAGLKQKVSLRQFAEGVKSVLKLFIFGYISYRTIMGELDRIVMMHGDEPRQGLETIFAIGLKLGFRTCIALIFFAGLDYWFQRWQYMKKLKMSHQEYKDEMKEREGDPLLKGRMRSIQMEIARKRMMQDVPEADIVVTNPTHYAVALRYDPEENFAPVLCAKGQNFVAQKIRALAEEHGVPLVEDPPLARALYKQGKVGQPIPAELFRAVAQLLASIYRLARARGRAWAQ